MSEEVIEEEISKSDGNKVIKPIFKINN